MLCTGTRQKGAGISISAIRLGEAKDCKLAKLLFPSCSSTKESVDRGVKRSGVSVI